MADEKRVVGDTGGGREQRERSADDSSIEQPSALGGDVATRSSTRPMPEDEKAGGTA